MKKIKIFFMVFFTLLILSGFTGTGYASDPSDTGTSGKNNRQQAIWDGLFNISRNEVFSPLSSTSFQNQAEGLSAVPSWLSKGSANGGQGISISRFGINFIFDPNSWIAGNDRQSRLSEYQGIYPDPMADDSFGGLNLSSLNDAGNSDRENLGYGLNISTGFYNTMVNLYLWYGNDRDISAPSTWSSARAWLQHVNNSSYFRSKNIAATWSKNLSFLSALHQGASPAIRLETAYKFDIREDRNTVFHSSDRINEYDRLSFGMAYEAKNNIGWLNPSGDINWGVGYSYKRALNISEVISESNSDTFADYDSHSGNVNASTYWLNMRLMTMVMYLYDLQSKDSMTMMQANYSPDWRWTYGVRANFFSGERKSFLQWVEKSDLVTFSVTYKWE